MNGVSASSFRNTEINSKGGNKTLNENNTQSVNKAKGKDSFNKKYMKKHQTSPIITGLLAAAGLFAVFKGRGHIANAAKTVKNKAGEYLVKSNIKGKGEKIWTGTKKAAGSIVKGAGNLLSGIKNKIIKK
ncbi:MAG: hypothetical protein LUG16_08575 [Candidatus Gastranaerophilales bacterium]|nr:hypothetical protein [Candidatus Gastranaerophilales bacterium]